MDMKFSNPLAAALDDLAVRCRKSVIGRYFSRSASAEKYPVNSPEWTALHSARLKNPVVKDITDIQPWFYYDRLTAAAGATPSQSLLFFASPMSATKTKLDTNMQLASQLPPPKSFVVTGIRSIFADMFAPDIELINTSYYNEFVIGDKPYAEGHFDLYPGGAGVYGAIASTAAASVDLVASNGLPTVQAINSWGMDRGIHIGQQQTFVFKAIAPSAVTLAASAAAVAGFKQAGRGMNIKVVLEGILYREVQ
jgi:hypothetical protein